MTERFIRDTSAPFNLEILALDNPAAGADFTVKLADGYTYELLSVTLQFVSNATAANRSIVIRANLGTDLLFSAPAEGLQPASETLYYSFAVGAHPYDLSGLSDIMTAVLPSPIPLPGATTISSLIEAIQATDQISNIRFYLKRWPILDT